MTKKPLVTIITPTYNQQAYLEEAIESVLAQTYSNWELILIDDGSTDDTVSIIRRYMAQDDRIQLIRTRNHGSGDDIRLIPTRFCRGELVTFMDSDDSLFPASLEKRVQYLIEHPEMVGVAAGYRYGENLENVSHSQFNVEYFLKGYLMRANWGYMFRQSVFQDVELKPFGLLGDAIVIYELCKHYPNQVHYLEDILYNYRYTPHGVSFSESGIQKRIQANLKTLNYLMSDTAVYTQYKAEVLHYVKLLINWELTNIKTSFPKRLALHGILGFYNQQFPYKYSFMRQLAWPLVLKQRSEKPVLIGRYTVGEKPVPKFQHDMLVFNNLPESVQKGQQRRICQPRIRQTITNSFPV